MKKVITSTALAGMIVAAAAFAQNAPGAGEPTAAHMQQMQTYTRQLQTYTQQMQAQMDAIQRTQDPAERRRLMQAHMQSMQAGMQTIHRMSGGTLEQRVNAMEQMLEQMLEHQHVMTDAMSERFKH